MTQTVMNLERVVSSMQEPMKRFVDRVQTLGGENCLAGDRGRRYCHVRL